MFDFRRDHLSSDLDIVSAPLSEALTKIRQVRGHSLEVAAAGIGLTPRRLSDIETGSCHPDPDTIHRMAAFYEIDTGRLGTSMEVRRTAPTVDPVNCVFWLGWLPISYEENGATNASILASIADGIRLLRSNDPTAAVSMRSKEFDLVMTMLDLDDEDLVADAVRALRLPWKKTEKLIAASRRRLESLSLVEDARGHLRLERNDG